MLSEYHLVSNMYISFHSFLSLSFLFILATDWFLDWLIALSLLFNSLIEKKNHSRQFFSMVDCLSCQSCCGNLRSSKFYPKEKRPISRKRAAQQAYLQKSNQNSKFSPFISPRRRYSRLESSRWCNEKTRCYLRSTYLLTHKFQWEREMNTWVFSIRE